VILFWFKCRPSKLPKSYKIHTYIFHMFNVSFNRFLIPYFWIDSRSIIYFFQLYLLLILDYTMVYSFTEPPSIPEIKNFCKNKKAMKIGKMEIVAPSINIP